MSAIPQAAPAPSATPTPGGNTSLAPGVDWGTAWNNAWNQGYNNANSSSNPYSGQAGGGYDLGQGYTLGQQAYISNMPKTGGSGSKGGRAHTQNTSAPQQQQSQNHPSGMTVQSPDQAAIDNYFSPLLDRIGQMRTDTQNGQQAFYNSYTDPYEALRPNLQNSYQLGQNNLQQAGVQNQGQYQNVMDSAKNLYNQLSRAYMQQFGGANSAGAFGQAMLGNQFQQGMGQAAGTYEQNVAGLQKQYQDLTTQYNTNIAQLDRAKTAALTQAQEAFQQKLQAIDALQTQTESQKAQAKVGALQQYQQDVYGAQAQIQAQQEALKQTALAGVAQIQNMAAMAQSYAGRTPDVAGYTQNLMGAYQNLPQSGVSATPTSTGTQISGYYDPTKYYGQ